MSNQPNLEHTILTATTQNPPAERIVILFPVITDCKAVHRAFVPHQRVQYHVAPTGSLLQMRIIPFTEPENAFSPDAATQDTALRWR